MQLFMAVRDLYILNGRPTGSIRISYGYMSTQTDCDKLMSLLRNYFVEGEPNRPETADPNSTIQVVGVFVYPVKSCRGIKVSAWNMTKQGLEFDRQWVIMEGSKVLTQKADPLMAQIVPRIDWRRGVLILSFSGLKDIEVDLVLSEDRRKNRIAEDICIGKICGEQMEGVSCGPEVANWLDTALGRQGLRLVRGLKRMSARESPSSTLANDSQILTLNISSILRLQERIKENCEKVGEDYTGFDDLDSLTDRFRGNLIIQGEISFGEEKWTTFSIQGKQGMVGKKEKKGREGMKGKEREEKENLYEDNSIKLKVLGPCRRCSMIRVEQSTGEMSKEPLRSLATFRDRNFCFGVHTQF
ncbi:molybdenum cofactor sulfurase isoform X2 [Eurytemora carolleeae]|uniref:molybdenum cofactor sulfurase isoform X2 n=1 Tax=Eurytemora carolleeae TaxID=1294199 RepID=UPI000C7638D5|nr:molybdenum cofactor sulfurase isoform X2 [Eurytemora carolleeae]|eukprot:XP_023320374.1 molybdenum cofactor sulfurase-like isoform X2 [Eurytemora affinis]